ncbi:MAG: biopolymer transporter ExbD [Candidatus Aminicenantes bacterium]|nr:biopolymer transporter ExbD [Candidatus Aminicenantes bacterium]
MGAKVGGAKELNSEPNVVPLCDILLVLLIIFMVVAPMVKKGVNVTLPEAVNAVDQPEAENMLTVYVQEDGSVLFNDNIVQDLTKLPALIEEQAEEKKMQEIKIGLRADVAIRYGRVQEVMTEIRNAGIEVIGLLVDRGSGSD